MNTTTERPPKPKALPVIAEAIPGELKARDQWVMWRFVWNAKEQKWDKPPKQIGGAPAKANDPATWTSFDKVLETYHRNPNFWGGIGYVPTADDPFVVGDLDNIRDPETGNLTAWTTALHGKFAGRVPDPLEIIANLQTYSEVSPSGKGLRFICKGTLPPHGRRKIGGKSDDCPDGRQQLAFREGYSVDRHGRRVARYGLLAQG